MFKILVRILRPPHKNAAEDSSVMGYNVYFVGIVPDIFEVCSAFTFKVKRSKKRTNCDFSSTLYCSMVNFLTL
jgi:hypothetical protein